MRLQAGESYLGALKADQCYSYVTKCTEVKGIEECVGLTNHLFVV